MKADGVLSNVARGGVSKLGLEAEVSLETAASCNSRKREGGAERGSG